MKMGYFWRKQYDPYKENTVCSPPWKARAVKTMTSYGDCSHFHLLIDGMCPGNMWPYEYPGILLGGNENHLLESTVKVLGVQKGVPACTRKLRSKKNAFAFYQ